MLFIMVGTLLRIALAQYGNIEPVLAIAMMAGLVLGGLWAFIVPLSIMAISDWAIDIMHYNSTFTWEQLLGISLFTWTGMMMAGYVATRMRPTLLYRMKGVAVFTGVAVMVTILYDLWTLVGLMIFVPYANIWYVLSAQIPFTIIHILSTLIFVPLFGTMYAYIHEYGLPLTEKLEAEAPEDETTSG